MGCSLEARADCDTSNFFLTEFDATPPSHALFPPTLFLETNLSSGGQLSAQRKTSAYIGNHCFTSLDLIICCCFVKLSNIAATNVGGAFASFPWLISWAVIFLLHKQNLMLRPSLTRAKSFCVCASWLVKSIDTTKIVRVTLTSIRQTLCLLKQHKVIKALGNRLGFWLILNLRLHTLWNIEW